MSNAPLPVEFASLREWADAAFAHGGAEIAAQVRCLLAAYDSTCAALAAAQRVCESLSERVAAQSELLAKKAE